MSGEEEIDDLIEELMVLEDRYHRLEKKERHKRDPIPKEELVFESIHINKAMDIIMKLMEDHNMTTGQIRTKVNNHQKWDEFWRINELLDKVQEIKVKGGKSKLRGQVEFIKQHTLYRPPSLTGSDEGGLMFKKVSQKYKSGAKKKKYTKKNKPSKKSEHNKKKTQTGGYPFWFDDVPKGMSRSQYKRLEKSKPKNKSMKVWIRENKNKKSKKNTKKKTKSKK